MKKTFLLLSAVILSVMFTAFQHSAAQSLQLDIRNQEIHGDTFFFDIYMSRNGGSADYYLGNADFVLTYNDTNFTSPQLGYVPYSADLVDDGGDSITTYEANLGYTIGSSGVNENKLIINVAQPAFSNQGEFESRIARIGTSQLTHKLGRFYITGMEDISVINELEWFLSGSGVRTQAFTLNTSTPWKSVKITTYTANNPTLETAPNTQTTNLTAYAKTDTSISLDWTRGNGDEVIILAKEAGAVGTDLPTDGIQYLADNTFGAGSEIGSTGVFVVYRGTDTTITVEGLDPNTTYHFAAVEVNGNGGYNENYNLSSPATTNETTNNAEPTIAASNFTITGFTTATLGTQVTKGDGAFRIFVVREGAAVNADPVDGTSYTGNTTFGSGDSTGTGNFVVYSGADSVVTIEGLDPATIYHVAVYEYNGSAGTENYLTTGPATGNRSTLQSEPTAEASDADFTATTTTLEFNFTSGDGVRRIILVKEGGAVDADPTDGQGYTADAALGDGDELGTGNFVVYDGTSNSVTVTGLDPNTTYHFEVFEYNGVGDSANYLTSATLTGSKTTLISEPTVQADSLEFTDWSTTTLDLRVKKGNGAFRIIVAREGSAVNADPEDGTSYTGNAAFGSGDSTGTGNYVVYAGSDSVVSVTALDPNTEYYFAVYEFSGSAGTENYLTTSPETGSRYTLDTEPTTEATADANGTITTTSMVINWTRGDGDSVIVLLREGSSVSADPEDGVDYLADAAFGDGSEIPTGNFVIYKGTGTSVTITGLDANKTYYYEVFEFNGGGEANNYLTSPTATGSGTTLQDVPTDQDSNIYVTNVATDSMRINWDRGNGDSSIVVVRAVNDLSASELPVSGTVYTANSVLKTGGTAIGSGWVVYKGVDTTVLITNLGQDTTYYVAVFSFSGANGGQAYNTDTTTANKVYENTHFLLNVTALLEGPMNADGQTMDTSLNVNNELPTTQPYGVAPFWYGGEEENANINSDVDVVDWVIVEVRMAATAGDADSTTRVARVAGLLLNDGSIVAEDGSSALTIDPDTSTYGEMYVVVYHRNHVAVLSASNPTFSSGAFEFDFTSGAAQAYGSDMAEVNGKYCLYTGNADASGSSILVVDADDRDAAWDDRNNSGYRAADVNMDGNVDAADRSMIWNNAGKAGQIND